MPWPGRAMASNLTGRQTPRPMSYQMAASLVAALSGSVAEVRIVRLSESTFIAEVALEGPSGAKVVDARPSDAINLALLAGAPVRASDELLEQWAPTYERAALDAYPDDANAIRAELDSAGFFGSPASPERLNEDAAEVLALARQEAHSRCHAAVGTGHILLALLRRASLKGPEVLACPSPPLRVPLMPRRARPNQSRPQPLRRGWCKCWCGPDAAPRRAPTQGHLPMTSWPPCSTARRFGGALNGRFSG